MIKTISIKAWKHNIAIVAEIQKEIVLDLEDIKFNAFSPLKFEETVRVREFINTHESIDDIGILADSISGAYGKDYFHKYFLNTNGDCPSIIDRLSFISSDGLGALEFEPSSNSQINDDVTFSF
ncbi:MAG: hypothetical protein Q9M32_03240 [Sulfurimonas sp.]|nr:hypothetical protein [Sulfurimonas sp.]